MKKGKKETALKRIHAWVDEADYTRLTVLARERREKPSQVLRLAIRELVDRLAPVGKPRRCPGCGFVEAGK